MSTIKERFRHILGGERPGNHGPVQAVWNGTVIAESERTVVVEGNHYFPPQDVNSEYLVASAHRTTCPWKGTASYFDLVISDERNPDAAWCYPNPKSAAAQIEDHVAFWHGIKVKRTAQG